MGIIKSIIDDYENLIKTQVTIPLGNDDIIKFKFRKQDLPHLLGLQYLVDIQELFEYSNGRLSATKLVDGMCDGTIDTEAFEKSVYFKDIYENRMKYFKSRTVLDIIKAKQIVKFNPNKIKVFNTKLEKLDYMFWKIICDENNNYGYFGIGFMTNKSADKNYPNTFFFRSDDQYISNQDRVLPLSLMITDKHRNTEFEIYWDKIRESMEKNKHCKFLLAKEELIDEFGTLNEDTLVTSVDEEVRKHYKLLLLDEIHKAYAPYMDSEFRWSNPEKEYIREKRMSMEKDYLPGEIKNLLNEFRQKKSIVVTADN